MKKVNVVRPKNENNFLRLLLSLKLAEYKIAAESFSEIVFFLVQYSFLFEDTEKVLNSCGIEQSQLYALQGNRETGARYLDPKYSRWLSTDPALGDYIPQAPINDEARKNNQNLPGMGGVFNPLNLNLYHYAANNPIKYIDPDGRTDFIYTIDEEGNKTVTEENNWGKWEWLHRDRYFVQTSDGTRYRANSKETVELYDWKKIDTNFLDGKFNDLIDNANEKATNFKRILDESVGGELDFKLSMEEDTLYYNGKVLYNRNEAGNFVWTYFLESHGYHFLHSPLAQAGSIIKGRLDEWHDTKARWSGFAYYWKSRFAGRVR